MRKRKIILTALIMLFLTVILIFTVFPLVYTILASFKTNTEIMTEPGKILPSHWNLENYQAVMKSKNFDIVRMLANSIIYTGLKNRLLSIMKTAEKEH